MQRIFIILVAISVSYTVSAQTDTLSQVRWFSNIGLGIQTDVLQDSPLRRYSLDMNRNRLLQLGLGREKAINERWSFIQEYRLRVVQLKTTYFSGAIIEREERSIPVTQKAQFNNWMLQAEVPIYWRYRLNNKLSFTAGAYASLDIFEYNSVEYETLAVDSADDYSEFGMSKGTSWFPEVHLGLEAGVLYKVNDQLDLRANLQQNIMGFSNSEVFGINGGPFQNPTLFRPALSIGANIKFKPKER